MSASQPVRVYERTPVTARTSVASLERFLDGAGWNGVDADAFLMVEGGSLHQYKEWRLSRDRREKPIWTWDAMCSPDIADAVERAAEALGIEPAAVLNDIAEAT